VVNAPFQDVSIRRTKKRGIRVADAPLVFVPGDEASVPCSFSLFPAPCSSLFPNVFVPDFRMLLDERFEEFAAIAAIEIDDLNTVFA